VNAYAQLLIGARATQLWIAPVLPVFRTAFVGSVLIMLALLGGFLAPVPTPPTRAVAPARGPLIDAAEHPEWAQFIAQAAYRRAEEIGRLLDLPSTPTVMNVEPPAEAPPPAQAQDALASLPAADAPAASPPQQDVNDVTGSIDEMPGGAIPVEIGETSSTELPLRDRETLPPVQPPASLKPPHESRRTAPAKRTARVRTKPQPSKPPAPASDDIFTRLFGTPGGTPAATTTR
jgi:hypothetical protein